MHPPAYGVYGGALPPRRSPALPATTGRSGERVRTPFETRSAVRCCSTALHTAFAIPLQECNDHSRTTEQPEVRVSLHGPLSTNLSPRQKPRGRGHARSQVVCIGSCDVLARRRFALLIWPASQKHSREMVEQREPCPAMEKPRCLPYIAASPCQSSAFVSLTADLRPSVHGTCIRDLHGRRGAVGSAQAQHGATTLHLFRFTIG